MTTLQEIVRSQKLKGHEYVWACLPITLVFIGGAIGGVCGAAASALNLKLMAGSSSPAQKYGMTGAISLAAAGLYFLLANLFVSITGLGGISADRVDRELRQSSMYLAIEKADPETYDKIRSTMVDALSHGKSEAQLQAAVLPYIAGLTRKYLPIASDEAVIKTTQVLTLEIDQIAAKSVDACFEFLYPLPGAPPIVISRYITPEVAQLDIAATGAVIESGLSNPQRIPTDRDVAPALNRAVGKVVAKYGAAEVSRLAKPTSMDKAKACELTSALYKEVLALPSKDAAPLLRFMFAQGSRI